MKMGVFFLNPLVPGFWSLYGVVGTVLTDIVLIGFVSRLCLSENPPSFQRATRPSSDEIFWDNKEKAQQSRNTLKRRRLAPFFAPNPASSQAHVPVVKDAHLTWRDSPHGFLALDAEIPIRENARNAAGISRLCIISVRYDDCLVAQYALNGIIVRMLPTVVSNPLQAPLLHPDHITPIHLLL